MSSLRAVSRSTRVLRYPVAALSAAFLVAVPTAHADANPVPPGLSGYFLIANAGQQMVLCADADDTVATVHQLTLSIDPYCMWQQSGDDGEMYMYNEAKGMVLGLNHSGSVYNNENVDLMPYDSTNGYEQWVLGDGTGWGYPMLPYKDQSYNLNAHDGSGKYVTVTGRTDPTRQDQSWSKVDVLKQ
ncbi:hypothetical protein ABT404_26545 [Streptomyces hyaluromycini]|uniref:Ricin B lectin domain-containing protein n=1 Tax=Streptomyces hyaluromycini TaxID=1377993 RepID=A0ABV1X1U9_9ACTN